MNYFSSIFIFTLIACISCSKEVRVMDHLDAYYQGKPCDVYFFKNWGTYSHPVKPLHPMEFDEAIRRDGYYRAWMCTKNNEILFVFFEGIEMSKKITAIPKVEKNSDKIHIYESRSLAGRIDVGRELNANDTIKINSFLISIPDHFDYLISVEQKSAISYEYKYHDNGKLQEVIVKNLDGKIKSFK
jgi:hypothetical protein